MSPSEQALACRLGLDLVQVRHGLMGLISEEASVDLELHAQEQVCAVACAS